MSWFSRRVKVQCGTCKRKIPVDHEGLLIPHAFHSYWKSLSWECRGSGTDAASHLSVIKEHEFETERVKRLY